MGSTEKMDMVPVHAHRFDLNLVSFLYAHGGLSYYLDHLFVEEGFSILDREDEVIMNLPCTVVSFSDSAFSIHLCSITKAPCSKLQGTFKFDEDIAAISPCRTSPFFRWRRKYRAGESYSRRKTLATI